MKIKSLLLGSAAALVAVSGAQAADAIIVEPEPVEYVRVCDAYGSGFFYIPGTETCMRISGYVRSQYQVDHTSRDGTDAGVDVTEDANVAVITGRYATTGASGVWGRATSQLSVTRHDDHDRHSWAYRVRLNVDVRNETEWGTLRSQLRIETAGDPANPQSGDTNTQDGIAVIDRALISVGGFRLGYSDSFTTTHHGYGYGGGAMNDGFYNFDQAIFLDYTWAANGFSVTVGAQDSQSGGDQFSSSGGIADFYAGFKYSGSWGNIAVSALHDGRAWDEVDWADGTDQWRINQGAWTWRASFDLDLSEYFAGGGLRGWYAASDSPYNNTIGYCGGADSHVPCDHEWGVSLHGNLSDNLIGYVGYSAVSGNDHLNNISYDAQDATVGISWTPISGLNIKSEYNWQVSENSQSAGLTRSGLVVDGGSRDTDRGRFRIRVTRSW